MSFNGVMVQNAYLRNLCRSWLIGEGGHIFLPRVLPLNLGGKFSLDGTVPYVYISIYSI